MFPGINPAQQGLEHPGHYPIRHQVLSGIIFIYLFLIYSLSWYFCSFHYSQLVAQRKASADDVQLYLDTAEDARLITEAYFDLKTPLYFDYSHLACRTSHPGMYT